MSGNGAQIGEYAAMGITPDNRANEAILERQLTSEAREVQGDVEQGIQPGEGAVGEGKNEKNQTSPREEDDEVDEKRRESPPSPVEPQHLGTEQPKNNLPLVMGALGLISFISALDQTILATALPTIAGELNADHSEYSWIATSYVLGQTLLTPLNGRLSDITGRKPMLYGAIGFMLVFSALSGAAKNVTWLIAARFFTGMGGGSIVSLSIIVISDVVPMRKRAAYQGYMGASFGIASVIGPILGGVLTQHSSWRWCFYINLPTCGVALILLIFFLKLNRPEGSQLSTLRKSFDFVGLLLVMAGAALLIVGFSTASDDGFGTPRAYAVIAAGGVTMILAVVHSLTTKRNAILPPRFLKTRTTLFFSLGSFLNSLIFLAINYLLPQFFQGVRGFDATKSGEAVIPFSFIVSVFVIISGQVTSRFKTARPAVWTGFAMACLGYGLFYRYLRPDVSLATQMGIQVIPGIGLGMALQSPMMIIQAAMPSKDMAASMSAWILLRSIAAAVGLAIFNSLLNTQLSSRFSKIPGYGTQFDVPRSLQDYQKLHDLPSGPVRDRVLSEFAKSFGICWIIGCALIGFALVITLFTKDYRLDRPKEEGVSAHVSKHKKSKKGSSETDQTASTGQIPGTPFSDKTLVPLDHDPGDSPQSSTHASQARQAEPEIPFDLLQRARSIPGEEGIIPLARSGSIVR